MICDSEGWGGGRHAAPSKDTHPTSLVFRPLRVRNPRHMADLVLSGFGSLVKQVAKPGASSCVGFAPTQTPPDPVLGDSAV